MVVVPTPCVFAMPIEPTALLIVAAKGFEELQVTLVVRFWVLLSV